MPAQVQRTRLGWDEAYTRVHVAHVFESVRPDNPDGIRHDELHAALQLSEGLRLLLLACEPRAAARGTTSTSSSRGRSGPTPAQAGWAQLRDAVRSTLAPPETT